MAAIPTVVLTGATSGIGAATARLLAPRVAHLVLHGPEPTAGVATLRSARIDYRQADYTRLADVRGLADDLASTVPEIDVLINNAAKAGAPHRQVTPDGHEATLQVNYLAPALLTDRLLATGRVRRVVNIASATHYSATLDLDDLDLTRGAYTGPAAYARSKLALVTYSCWLARHHPDVEVVSMHPGVIATDLLHTMFSVTGAAPTTAAANIAEVITHHGDTGTYYDETTPAAPDPTATDPAVQERLRALTVAVTAAPGARRSSPQ